MKRLIFKAALYFLAFSLAFRSAFSSETPLAKEESTPSPIKRPADSSLDLNPKDFQNLPLKRLALNTNEALIEPVKQVATAYASLPGAVANSYGSLSANVFDSVSSFLNKVVNIFGRPIS